MLHCKQTKKNANTSIMSSLGGKMKEITTLLTTSDTKVCIVNKN